MINQKRLAKIKQAEAQTSEQLTTADGRKNLFQIGAFILGLVALGLLIFILVLQRRYRQIRTKVTDMRLLNYQLPSELPPALVAYQLIGEQVTLPQLITATIIDLIARGYLELTGTTLGNGWLKVIDDDNQLYQYERLIVRSIFSSNGIMLENMQVGMTINLRKISLKRVQLKKIKAQIEYTGHDKKIINQRATKKEQFWILFAAMLSLISIFVYGTIYLVNLQLQSKLILGGLIVLCLIFILSLFCWYHRQPIYQASQLNYVQQWWQWFENWHTSDKAQIEALFATGELSKQVFGYALALGMNDLGSKLLNAKPNKMQDKLFWQLTPGAVCVQYKLKTLISDAYMIKMKTFLEAVHH